MIVRAHRPEALPPASDRLVVVEASAGTGKTYFLEHRVVDLILAGADLSQILLVTFTDKAVAELRMRIRDLLDRLARQTSDTGTGWEIDDDGRTRLRTAVTAFDHAPIFTIHAYCHRVLVEDAFAARRLFEQQQVADEVAFDAAFAALLREQFARDPADKELLAAYLEADRTIDALRDLLLRCARTGAPLRRVADPGSLGDDLRRAFGTAEARTRAFAAVEGRGKQWAQTWLDVIGAAVPPEGASPARVLAAVDAMRREAGKLLAYFGKTPALRDVLQRASTCTSLGEAVAAAFLPRVLARVAEDKSERGQLDYDDMLTLVDRALRDERGDELAARLRARTPWVMIDEFQDTDPVQWRIFRSVWVHPEARGLVIVGDPKQAIYGFRGADVETYLAAREELVRLGATRVSLDVNRRSTAPLVEAVNQILQGPLGGALLQGKIEYDVPVKPCGEIVCDEPDPVRVLALDGGDKDAQRLALRTAIADEIEALRAAPPRWRGRHGEVPFSLGQVMVLTRSNSDAIDVAGALRARGLPCALVESDKLFETREAAELAAVLAAVAAPRDRSARLRALRTRFFDVPWADLMKVVDAPDHHPAITRLYDWAALATRRQYESLFRRLLEDSRFAERAIVLGGGERAIANTWHLIELLHEEVARSRSDLHELVTQLRRWIDDREDRFDDRDVQRAETDADAIRVLTVHKAKGLEAPYVFLYGGISKPPGGVKVQTLREASERWLVVEPKEPELLARLDAENDAENQRLAYVALTRAQVRMWLPLYHGEKTVAERSMYRPIQRCLRPLETKLRSISIAAGAAAAAPTPGDALAAFAARPPPASAELAPLDAVRRGLATLTYTRLAHDASVLEPGARGAAMSALALDPAEFDVDDARGEVGDDELPPGAASGLMLHDVLEVADLAFAKQARDVAAWSADPIVADQLRGAARARGIADVYLPHAARVVHAALTQPLRLTDGDELPPLVEAAQLAREVEFAFPLPGARGLARGYIDALVAWDDALWVLDYKSDVLAGDDLIAAARARAAERYGVQTRIYALAAERMRGKRRLAGMLFAFVRHGVVASVRMNDDTIADWSTWLAQRAMEVRA